MGLNATIVATGPVTDDQLAHLNHLLADRKGEVVANDYTGQWPEAPTWAERYSLDGHEWVEISTMERLYSQGYERGKWPLIYATIILVRTALPDATVRYGSDSGDEWELPEADDEAMAEIWQHWASDDGMNYRRE